MPKFLVLNSSRRSCSNCGKVHRESSTVPNLFSSKRATHVTCRLFIFTTAKSMTMLSMLTMFLQPPNAIFIRTFSLCRCYVVLNGNWFFFHVRCRHFLTRHLFSSPKANVELPSERQLPQFWLTDSSPSTITLDDFLPSIRSSNPPASCDYQISIDQLNNLS